MEIDITVSKPLSGDENMRLDKENLIKAEQFSGDKIFIRIYEWLAPTISLGISQSNNQFDLKKMRKDGIDLVKRITGGKAVWHEKEITYSVAAGLHNVIFGDSLYNSYKIVSAILVCFLKRLKVEAQIIRKKPSRQISNICYERSGLYEINVWGEKLIGSAQKRTKTAFLQHGSIPVFSNQAKLCHYLVETEKITERENKATFLCLNDIIKNPNVESLKTTLKKVFHQEINKLLRMSRS